MIITIKTLKNEKHDLEIAQSDTVAQIKQKIHDKLKLGEPETQKLIHHGKILKDDQTAESAGFKENDFLVVMVRKVNPKKKEKKSVPETTTDTQPSQPDNQQSDNKPETSSQQNANQNANNQPQNNDDDTGLLTGPGLEQAIQDCVDMGFERDQVVRCFRAAFNNKQRAIQYLMDGIPADAQPAQPQQPQQPPQGQPQAQGQQGQQAQPAQQQAQGGQGDAAAFQQLLQGGNQQMLAGLVAQLAQQNPQLLQAIRQNPQALNQALADPAIMQQLMGMMYMQQLQQGNGQNGDGQGNGQGLGNLANLFGNMQQQRPGTIQVTQEEKGAIERLQKLGFSEPQAVEAFFSCDKNEMLAANYLIENYSLNQMMDDDMGLGNIGNEQQQPNQQEPQQSQNQQQPKNDEKPKESDDKDKKNDNKDEKPNESESNKDDKADSKNDANKK